MASGWAAARVWGERPKVQAKERAPALRAVRMSTSESPIMTVSAAVIGGPCFRQDIGLFDEHVEAVGVWPPPPLVWKELPP